MKKMPEANICRFLLVTFGDMKIQIYRLYTVNNIHTAERKFIIIRRMLV